MNPFDEGYFDSAEYVALELEGDRVYACQVCGAAALMENWSDKYLTLHAEWQHERDR